jgi:hypothetical protein
MSRRHPLSSLAIQRMLQKDNSGSLIDESTLRGRGFTRSTKVALSLNGRQALVNHPHRNAQGLSQLPRKGLRIHC